MYISIVVLTDTLSRSHSCDCFPIKRRGQGFSVRVKDTAGFAEAQDGDQRDARFQMDEGWVRLPWRGANICLRSIMFVTTWAVMTCAIPAVLGSVP